MNRTSTLVIVKVALGAGLALGFAAAPHGTAHAESAPVIEEDAPQWDCRYEGNRICGVGAALPDGSAAVPGDYSDDNCRPGAVYCPPAGTPVDVTAGVEIS
jgi:hypothetical protein